MYQNLIIKVFKGCLDTLLDTTAYMEGYGGRGRGRGRERGGGNYCFGTGYSHSLGTLAGYCCGCVVVMDLIHDSHDLYMTLLRLVIMSYTGHEFDFRKIMYFVVRLTELDVKTC